MYKWQNQSKDYVFSEGSVYSKICESLYGKDLAYYTGRKPFRIDSKPEDSFVMYNLLHKFTVELIGKTSGILRDGLIKRLLKSEGVGLIIDGSTESAIICIGKQKKKLGNAPIISNIYISAENLVMKELDKVYIELGYQYISDYSKTSKIGLRFYGDTNIDSQDLRLCPVELEPGLYDVDEAILNLLIDSNRGRQIYRSGSEWKVFSGVRPETIRILGDISNILRGSCIGNRIIMKVVNDEVELIDERQLYEGGAEVKHRIAESVINPQINRLIAELGHYTPIHSVKWDIDSLGKASSLWCDSCEKGAIDLWVR